MAQSVLPVEPPLRLVDEQAMAWPTIEPVIVGMPQLCRAGLSENWLFKACGHRHWLALAAAYGLERPDFLGEDRERLYPAFTNVTLERRGSGLLTVRENAKVDFALTLHRISRTRFRSIIEVTANAVPIAQVTMQSAFVHRVIAGSNNSAARRVVARPCRLMPPAGRMIAPFRPEHWNDVLGFSQDGRTCLAEFTVDPNPHEDFNGANFLYFSAFQAMLDRAEWAWFRSSGCPATTKHRTIHYLGNAELGDRVNLILCGLRNDSSARRSHWIEMHRESDSKPIAICFSERDWIVLNEQ